MKLGKVIGRVTFSKLVPSLEGGRYLFVVPVTRQDLISKSYENVKKLNPVFSPIVYDKMGCYTGDIIGYIEGAEATAPFDEPTPIDAISAAIIDRIDYKAEK